jgi:predicted metal-dependent phosphoesterase TrpH
MRAGRRLDLHVHSRHSPDGAASVPDLVAWAVSAGLDGLALTDHNTLAGHAELAEAARQHADLRLIPGVEVSTRDGHLLVYGVRELPPVAEPLDATVDWATSHGGVPVLAHPFRRTHGVGGALAVAARVPAIEAVNAHNAPRANRRAVALAERRGVGTTGGTDAHTSREVGGAWTTFPPDVDSVEQLLSALGAGRTTAAGRSLPWARRLRVAARSLALRLGRGGRPL